MSRQAKFLVLSLVCLTVLVILLAVSPVQAGKPKPPISLKANFETVWYDGLGVARDTKIRNDVEGSLYVDTADTKKIKYGVYVKYEIPGAWDTRGRFKMKVDRAGVLGRYALFSFDQPTTDPSCVSTREGCGIDPLGGGTGTIDTRVLEIWTPIVLVENNGVLVKDSSQPIGMDVMKTGEMKYVGLDISFTPDDPNFDHVYKLGYSVCEANDLWGAAELYCLQAGQVWEFRPCSKVFINEPDNAWRLLQGIVQIDYLTACKLRKWNMPFVLRVCR
jgi:hypothetical protein